MAFIDYGCIVFKNGKIVNKDNYFNDMKEMVGWEDDGSTPVYEGYKKTGDTFQLKDNCFSYIGDKDLTFGFYKDVFHVYETDHYCKEDGPVIESFYLTWTDYIWSKWSKYFYYDGGSADVTVSRRNGYLVFKTTYKGNKYKVYFGYGVDLDCYKKYHFVNYYRTPWFLVRDFFDYRVKEFFKELKWRLKG